MSEDTVTIPRKVTVGYERRVQVRDYEPATASIYVEANTPLDATDEQVAEAAAAAFTVAKSIVWQQLGIPFDIDINGTAVEAMQKQFAAVEVGTPTQAAPAAKAPYTPPAGDAEKIGKADLVAELLRNPSNFFDNRKDKKNPRGPDWKRKKTGEGLWLSDKELQGVDVPASGYANG